MGPLIAALQTNVNSVQINNAQIAGGTSLENNYVTANARSTNRVTGSNAGKSAADQADSGITGTSASGKDAVSISPLFRPFLRLPQELQDEIFYHAVGYTGHVNIVRAIPVQNAGLFYKPPITISKLFRISKMINEHMIAHIFRSTNFHFGMTGFTKFLWQIGPVNRSCLQHLTFRFGKTSLLHCVRWLAPDSIWELFEPPVVTNPFALTYFWRCQIQDLMKELTLLTLTVDIGDVPLADVPMLVRVFKSAIGSIQHIRIIDNLGSGRQSEVRNQALDKRFPDFQQPTWRELALKYHADYKHQRWHMRHKLTQSVLDARPVLEEWMDQDRLFFDA
ncbi:hypothetical protein N0V86_000906 [Didymella sp. IMI 355093]|nr:hypothetical protein N0V86_000906 [Didymella sp. IMI 355093]